MYVSNTCWEKLCEGVHSRPQKRIAWPLKKYVCSAVSAKRIAKSNTYFTYILLENSIYCKRKCDYIHFESYSQQESSENMCLK